MVTDPAGPRRGYAAVNDKRKHKRGHTAHMVLAYTPLTMDDCIDRMRGGHFPIRSLSVHVQAEDQQVSVELLNKNTFRKMYPSRNSQWQWPEPVWFEATFTSSDNGLTRIQGQIKQAITLSYRIFAAQFFLLGVLGIALVAAFSSQQHPTDTLMALALFWGIIMISVLIAFTINKRRAGRLTRALQSWLSNRLDI